MEDNKTKAEKLYVSQWSRNAKQHYDDGDYNWLCDFIRVNAKYCHGVVEIGCGAGYSTLAFLEAGFDVVSFDFNQEAIDATKALLVNKDHDATAVIKADVVHELNEIRLAIDNIPGATELIVLCNPGGNVNSEITKGELRLLKMFGFSDEEIIDNYNCGRIHMLHKWAMIYGACSLAILCGKPILIVERGDESEIGDLLNQISIDTGCRCVCSGLHEIENAPSDGVRLSFSVDKSFWGAAIYYPE